MELSEKLTPTELELNWVRRWAESHPNPNRAIIIGSQSYTPNNILEVVEKWHKQEHYKPPKIFEYMIKAYRTSMIYED